jgi:segregation and condensation protein A
LVDRLDIVVRFLAVLELYKQGLIDIEQFDSFAEIGIVWIASPDLDVTELASIDVYDG